MKTIFNPFYLYTILLLLLANNVQAQNPFGNADMQAMMQNMQAIQECMMKVDQEKLMALSEQAKAVQEKIQKACESNDVKRAEKEAMQFVESLKASPEVKQVQACAKDLPDMMKGHIPYSSMQDMEKDFEKKDICSAQM